MKIAYLLFVYKNPRLLRKIIDSLSCEDAAFFIHLDAKSDRAAFSEIAGRNVFFIDTPIPVFWAEFSGVRAILSLIQQALAFPARFDYFVLLSGSEYPLRDKTYIHQFLERHRGTEFITLVKMPNEAAGKPISRINTRRFPSDRPVRRFLFKILARLGLAKRDYARFLVGLDPYAGNTWWALSRAACEYLLDFTDRNPAVTKYFEETFAPEEMYVHTVLGNSPFRSQMRRNLLYEDWGEKGGHPAMINETHLAFFEGSSAIELQDIHGPGELLFARKFSDANLVMVSGMQELVKRKSQLEDLGPNSSGATPIG
jgi:hypothetical protein